MTPATLIYLSDPSGRQLLLHREKEPNLGLWTPVGGHIERARRESPHEAAARELREELLLDRAPEPLVLRGLVTERGVDATGRPSDWCLFVYTATLPPELAPARGPEGEMRWFTRAELATLPLPQTDREILWPLILSDTPFFALTMEWDGEKVTGWRREQ